jgi:hypothetical protein
MKKEFYLNLYAAAVITTREKLENSDKWAAIIIDACEWGKECRIFDYSYNLGNLAIVFVFNMYLIKAKVIQDL